MPSISRKWCVREQIIKKYMERSNSELKMQINSVGLSMYFDDCERSDSFVKKNWSILIWRVESFNV